MGSKEKKRLRHSYGPRVVLFVALAISVTIVREEIRSEKSDLLCRYSERDNKLRQTSNSTFFEFMLKPACIVLGCIARLMHGTFGEKKYYTIEQELS